MGCIRVLCSPPLLFNIYMDEVIKDILHTFKEHIFKKIYADDLVIIVAELHLNHFIETAVASFTKYGLIFNQKKSQIFELRKKSKKSTQISTPVLPVQKLRTQNLDTVEEYNYLGIRLNFKGDMQPHLRFLRSRCAYLEGSIRFYAKDLSFKN